MMPLVGDQAVRNYVTWTGSATRRTVRTMATNPHNVNVAIARCDLERLVREHIHGGVLPGQLLEELLDMCVNLRDMARVTPANHDPRDPGQEASWTVGNSPTVTGEQSPRLSADAEARVRWLRPTPGASGPSGEEPHMQGEDDTDQGLAHD